MTRVLGQILDGKPYGRCYIISNINTMSLITGKEVSDSLFKKFINDMLALGLNPISGKHITAGPNYSIPRWRDNMGDNFRVEKLEIFSPKFWVNIARGIPMCISIGVGEQFRSDREDEILDDLILDDKVKSGHVIVIKGWRLYDSRSDQKTYSLTRKYLETVKGLIQHRYALQFIKQ